MFNCTICTGITGSSGASETAVSFNSKLIVLFISINPTFVALSLLVIFVITT
jgi:hypothetical protein